MHEFMVVLWIKSVSFSDNLCHFHFFNLSSRNKKFRSVERTVFDWLLTVKLDCDWWRFSFYSQTKFWLWRFSKSVTAKINFWLWRFFEVDTAKKNFWLWRFFESQKNGCGKNEISFWLWNLSGPGLYKKLRLYCIKKILSLWYDFDSNIIVKVRSHVGRTYRTT